VKSDGKSDGKAGVFIAGLAMAVWVPVGGELYLFEIVAPLIVLINWKTLSGYPRLKRFMFFGLLWAVAQLFSDSLHHLSLSEILKGQALISFLIIDLLAIIVLVRKQIDRLVWLTAGFGAATLVGFVFQPNMYAAAYPWKFGFGAGISILVMVLTTLPRARSTALIFVALLASTNLYLGSRSQSLILGAALVATLISRISKPGTRRVFAVVCLAVVVPSSLIVYSQLASSGRLGTETQMKNEIQTSGMLGVLGGRPEFIYAGYALITFPMMGLGSNALDDGGVLDKGRQALIRLRYSEDLLVSSRTNPYEVPLHSYMLGALARAGVLAGPFWLAALLFLCRALLRVRRQPPEQRLFLYFLFFSALWDLNFSPLGSSGRFLFALELCAAIILIEKPKERNVHDSDDFVQSGGLRTSNDRVDPAAAT
jgi:hypothetical protein